MPPPSFTWRCSRFISASSASIDDATGGQSFRFITLPLILPVLTVALFNLTLRGINSVGMVFSLTGGPGTAPEVLSYLLYVAVSALRATHKQDPRHCEEWRRESSCAQMMYYAFDFDV